jgi:hypothetical protein
MQPPSTSDERFDFCMKLQRKLKPDGFWVTDFLARGLMDVEWTFCDGEASNEATVKCCAAHCEAILRLETPGVQDIGDCLKLSSMAVAAKPDVDALLRLSGLPDVCMATNEQACRAVSGFFHLVFTRCV